MVGLEESVICDKSLRSLARYMPWPANLAVKRTAVLSRSKIVVQI